MTTTVKADGHSGMSWSILQLFGFSPKFLTRCGNCKLSFYVRPAMVDQPGVLCPNPKCHAINIMELYVPKNKPLPTRALIYSCGLATTAAVIVVRLGRKVISCIQKTKAGDK